MSVPSGRPPVPAATGGSTRRRISPGMVFVAIALIASVAYVAYAVTVRDASQIPLLASGAVVVAIAFGALSAYCFGAVLRAGRAGHGGRAILIALVGGFAAIATSAAAAAAIILFQLAAS